MGGGKAGPAARAAAAEKAAAAKTADVETTEAEAASETDDDEEKSFAHSAEDAAAAAIAETTTLSSTWQPRLLLQSFCSRASSASVVWIPVPRTALKPQLRSISSKSSRQQQKELWPVLYSLCDSSLFAIPLEPLHALEAQVAGARCAADEKIAPAVRRPAAAPQCVVDAELTEGLSAFAVFDISSSLVQKNVLHDNASICSSSCSVASVDASINGSSGAEKNEANRNAGENTAAATGDGGAVEANAVFLVTAGASTGLLRCFSVTVKPKLLEEEAGAGTATAVPALCRRSQQSSTLEDKFNGITAGTPAAQRSVSWNSGEDGSGAWLHLRELRVWRGESNNTAAAAPRVLVASGVFPAPELRRSKSNNSSALEQQEPQKRQQQRSFVCCIAAGYADGRIDCSLLLLRCAPSCASARTDSGAAANSCTTSTVAGVGSSISTQQEIPLVMEVLQQRCFQTRLSGEGVATMRFHPQRLLLAVGGDRGKLRIYDIAQLAVASAISLSGGSGAATSASAAARAAAAVGGVEFELEDHSSCVNALAFLLPVAPCKSSDFSEQQLLHQQRLLQQQVGWLVSAAGDKLLCVWALDSEKSSSTGCFAAAAAEQQLQKHRGKQHTSKAKPTQRGRGRLGCTPVVQIPTSELVTSLAALPWQLQHQLFSAAFVAAPHTKRSNDAGQTAPHPAGGLWVLAGGDSGFVSLWNLTQRKVLSTLALPTTSTTSSATALQASLTCVVRSLQVLQNPQKQWQQISVTDESIDACVLAAQDSSILSVLPLTHLVSKTRHSNSAAAITPQQKTDTRVAKDDETAKTPTAEKEEKNPFTKSKYFVGRFDSVLACKFLPPPPPQCCCPCCCRRRQHVAEAFTCSTSEIPCSGGSSTADALRHPCVPSSLVALVGEKQPWLLRLDSPAAGEPAGWGAVRTAATALGTTAAISKYQPEGDAASCFDVSRNGCWLVSGSRDGSIGVYHMASQRLVAQVPRGHHSACITAVAMQQRNWPRPSPLLRKRKKRDSDPNVAAVAPEQSAAANSRAILCSCDCRGLSPRSPHTLLFAASSAGDFVVKVWQLCISSSMICCGSSSCDSSDNRSTDGEVYVLRESIASAVAHKKEINDMKISPNDALLCTASQDKTAKLFAFPSLAYIGELRGHARSIFSCAFSRTDRIVVTASADATLKLWSIDTLSCLRTFQNPGDGGLLAVAFLSRDSQLMSSTSHGQVLLWNVRTAECVSTLTDVHTDKIWGMDLHGRMLVTAGIDGRVCFWEDITATLQQRTRLQHLHEARELGALKLLELEGKGEEVFTLLLRLRRRAGTREFLERYCRRSVALLQQQQQQSLQQLERQQHQGLQLGRVLRQLRGGELHTLLRFIVDWNSNSQTAWLAQGLLHALLHHGGGLNGLMHALTSGPEGSDETKNISRDEVKQLVQAFNAYSARHERRLEGLIEKTFLLDLLLQSGCWGGAVTADGTWGEDNATKADVEANGESASVACATDTKKEKCRKVKEDAYPGGIQRNIRAKHDTEAAGAQQEQSTAVEITTDSPLQFDISASVGFTSVADGNLTHGTDFTRQCLYSSDDDESEAVRNVH